MSPFLQAIQSAQLGRVEDPKYLEWVRTLPCVCCGGAKGPSEAHHAYGVMTKGGGTKQWDYASLPLCHEDHLGDSGVHKDVARWEERYGPQIEHVAATLLRAIYSGFKFKPRGGKIGRFNGELFVPG